MQMATESAKLMALINKYKINRDFNLVKKEFFELANLQMDAVSSMSPTGGIRTREYVSFRRTLNTLLEDYLINDKQFHIFLELFAHEDFNI